MIRERGWFFNSRSRKSTVRAVIFVGGTSSILVQFRQLMLLAYVLIFGYVRGHKTRLGEGNMGGE